MTTTEHVGEILLLIPGWTLWLSLDASCGDSLTCYYAPNDDKMSSLGRVRESPHHALSSFRAWWGDSLTHPRLDSLIIIRCMVRRFSYSPPCAKRRRDVLPGASKKSPHHALNNINRAWWGRFSYLPQAGHLSSSFVA